MLLAAVTFVCLAASAAVLLLALGARSGSDRVTQAQAYRVTTPETAPADVGPVDEHADSAVLGAVDRLLTDHDRQRPTAERLGLAGMSMRPAEWVLLQLAVGVVAGVLVLLGTGLVLLAVPVAPLAGWGLPTLWLRMRTTRRTAAFGEQLPDVLQLVASSLRSGFSLSQALDSAVRDGHQPAAGELARALTQSRLGVDLEDALDAVAVRMRSQDLTWVVMAVRISREVGGNLAEVLMTTMHTMRQRGQLRRQVKALSAEGRLSAYVLVAMPLGLGGWLFTMRREYLRPLWTTGPGIVMLVVAALGMVVGAFWMSKIVKVDV